MQNIIDISIDNPKQQIRLNGDDSKIIELDLSDSAILVRFDEGVNAIQKLLATRDELRQNIADFKDSENEEESLNRFNILAKSFADTEREMRDIINTIFDYDVCTPFAGKTSVFSIKNGVVLYETIIDKLANLYGTALKEESDKLKARLSKHTSKYIKK